MRLPRDFRGSGREESESPSDEESESPGSPPPPAFPPRGGRFPPLPPALPLGPALGESYPLKTSSPGTSSSILSGNGLDGGGGGCWLAARVLTA